MRKKKERITSNEQQGQVLTFAYFKHAAFPSRRFARNLCELRGQVLPFAFLWYARNMQIGCCFRAFHHCDLPSSSRSASTLALSLGMSVWIVRHTMLSSVSV